VVHVQIARSSTKNRSNLALVHSLRIATAIDRLQPPIATASRRCAATMCAIRGYRLMGSAMEARLS
jgi:hypothetical protein